MPADSPSEPWRSFLLDLDDELEGATELHCLGGFVVAEYYGLMRPTADIDIIEATGATDLKSLAALAGKGSALAKQHHVYLDIVTVATVPEDYPSRLIHIFPETFENLRLRAFERYDLVLAKLTRNGDHDREDVRRLAAAGPGLEPSILQKRYEKELRFQSSNPGRDDLTLALWIEMIKEVQARRK